MCKHINFEYFCEELFLVKHKTKHTCESALFYKIDENLIKENCNFEYFYDIQVTPSILDGGDTLILANMFDQKNLQCSRHQNMAHPIANHPYIMVNRSILCDCRLETGMSYLYKSLSSCAENSSIQIMHVTVNLAFNLFFQDMINKTKTLYIDKTKISHSNEQNAISELGSHKQEENFPIYLEDIRDPLTLDQPQSLKQLLTVVNGNYGVIKNDDHNSISQDSSIHYSDYERSNLQNYYLDDSNIKHKYEDPLPFLESWGTQLFQFIGSLMAVGSSGAVAYIFSKHSKLAAITAHLAVQQIQNTNAAPTLRQDVKPSKVICQNMTLGLVITVFSLIGLMIYIVKILRTMTWCKGKRYNSKSTLYLCITKEDRYQTIKLTSMKGHIPFFTCKGHLNGSAVKLVKSHCWDILQINWNDIIIYYNQSPIQIPSTISLSMFDKVSNRYIFNSEHLDLTIMVKQGNTWYNVEENSYEREPGIKDA
jgi:hypothetical protein